MCTPVGRMRTNGYGTPTGKSENRAGRRGASGSASLHAWPPARDGVGVSLSNSRREASSVQFSSADRLAQPAIEAKSRNVPRTTTARQPCRVSCECDGCKAISLLVLRVWRLDTTQEQDSRHTCTAESIDLIYCIKLHLGLTSVFTSVQPRSLHLLQQGQHAGHNLTQR